MGLMNPVDPERVRKRLGSSVELRVENNHSAYVKIHSF